MKIFLRTKSLLRDGWGRDCWKALGSKGGRVKTPRKGRLQTSKMKYMGSNAADEVSVMA